MQSTVTSSPRLHPERSALCLPGCGLGVCSRSRHPGLFNRPQLYDDAGLCSAYRICPYAWPGRLVAHSVSVGWPIATEIHLLDALAEWLICSSVFVRELDERAHSGRGLGLCISSGERAGYLLADGIPGAPGAGVYISIACSARCASPASDRVIHPNKRPVICENSIRSLEYWPHRSLFCRFSATSFSSSLVPNAMMGCPVPEIMNTITG
jgi:hypothetical protein